MIVWDYHRLYLRDNQYDEEIEILNDLGAQGWEAFALNVTDLGTTWMLKRQRDVETIETYSFGDDRPIRVIEEARLESISLVAEEPDPAKGVYPVEVSNPDTGYIYSNESLRKNPCDASVIWNVCSGPCSGEFEHGARVRLRNNLSPHDE